MTEKFGLVFYPREYILKDENPVNHFAKGVDHNGNEIVICIRPSDIASGNAKNAATAQTIPSLAEFAETHRRAMKPCHAHPENSPENPCGILLVEQASIEEDLTKRSGKTVYQCAWASVLREDADMPVPLIGKGYLELNFYHLEGELASSLKEDWVQMKRRLANPNIDESEKIIIIQKMEECYNGYINEQGKKFVGVIMEDHKIESCNFATPSEIKERLNKILSFDCPTGTYRGAKIRVRNSNEVKTRASFSVNVGYNSKEKRPESASEAIEKFFKFNKKKITSVCHESNQIDIIPTIRVNCGKLGNDKYSKEIAPQGKFQKIYIDRRFQNTPGNFAQDYNGYLYADVAIRLAEITKTGSGQGNLLLSSIHAFSSPKGNALSIGDNENLKMDFMTQ